MKVGGDVFSWPELPFAGDKDRRCGYVYSSLELSTTFSGYSSDGRTSRKSSHVEDPREDEIVLW